MSQRRSLPFVMTLVLAATAVAAAAKPISNAAPADEYFGAQKMSAIGIRMRVDALGRQYHARTIADSDLVHDATMAEQSMIAWHAKYPNDPWLPSAAFHLEQLFQTVQSNDARAEATKMLHFVANNFSKTTFAHASRIRLAQGFPALQPETALVASPAPAAPVPAGTMADSVSASPSPAAASTAPVGAQPAGSPAPAAASVPPAR